MFPSDTIAEWLLCSKRPTARCSGCASTRTASKHSQLRSILSNGYHLACASLTVRDAPHRPQALSPCTLDDGLHGTPYATFVDGVEDQYGRTSNSLRPFQFVTPSLLLHLLSTRLSHPLRVPVRLRNTVFSRAYTISDTRMMYVM